MITDLPPPLKQEAALAKRRDSSPAPPAVDPAVTPAPANPNPIPASVQVTLPRAEQATQHGVAGQDDQPPRLARSASPKPPPISPAESSSLLGRFIAAYNQGDLGTMRTLFGPGNPVLNQYQNLFSRTTARQLTVTDFNWRLTPTGALGRGSLSLQLREHGLVPTQSYRGSLELELGRQEGGRPYIRRIQHRLITSPAPATPRTPEQSYGGNG